MLHDPKSNSPNHGRSHMMPILQEQADVASYITDLAESLRVLAKKHHLNFAAFCLEVTRDSAFEASSTRLALRNRIQAHMAAKAACNPEMS